MIVQPQQQAKGQRQNIQRSVKVSCQKNCTQDISSQKVQIGDAIAYPVLVAPLQY
ncbi:hypothetical protein PQG02_06720 [Nostoc sp. UHCC 0926]|nr:hypothetical protein PQG02_06720 [Nostoc sp. UHCC 0926]